MGLLESSSRLETIWGNTVPLLELSRTKNPFWLFRYLVTFFDLHLLCLMVCGVDRNPDITILHLHVFLGRFSGIPKCSIDLGEPDSSECAWWKPWNENGRTFPNATLSLVLLFEHIGNLIYFHHIWKANKVRDAISKENRGNKTNVRFRSGYWVG